MAETIAQLRELSDGDLIQQHDVLAKNTAVGIAHYLAELSRRDQQKTSDEMLEYTRAMDRMTKRITLLAVITTVATLITTVKVIVDWFTVK
jgi:hypothetical protein